ncbi:Alpha/Beta hydrolase protein [Dactylonectria estremocensis]|uniref:Alpha/Beta hydrolase protein n=1 Tax=Dactylonectria estremocensis TaxID=1079267 RepID=A0A9P9J569_9HYPO|nr:Alpha/Beta hydrolase protein [Dactylonectria estremocensis]
MDIVNTDFTVPSSVPHTHTVVFLHGRGDKPRNFASSLLRSRDSQDRSLYEAFPSIRWVFPAPAAAAPNERQCQWFDVYSVVDFADHEDVQMPGLRVSVDLTRNVLEREAAALDGRWDRIVLAGISQGAATGVHTLLNLSIPSPPGQESIPRGLAAFLSFSARLPFTGRNLAATRAVLSLDDVPTHNDVLRNTPMLLEHCVDDGLVLVTHGRALRDSLKTFGADVGWREYPDGGHWFNSPTGMEDAVVFLEKALGIPRAAAAAKPRWACQAQ